MLNSVIGGPSPQQVCPALLIELVSIEEIDGLLVGEVETSLQLVVLTKRKVGLCAVRCLFDMDVAIRRQPHYATLESKSRPTEFRVFGCRGKVEVHADLIDVASSWPNQRGLNLDAYFPALTIKDGARTTRQITEAA